MAPIVTISREAFKNLMAMSLGHAREGGGLLVGRTTIRSNVRIYYVTGMTHIQACDGTIEYNDDEIAKAKRAVHSVYRPLEAVGEWHTHPYPSCSDEALEAQISPPDVEAMNEGELELITVTFPSPGYQIEADEFRLLRCIDNTVFYAEAYMRDSVRASRCTVRLR